MRLITYPNKTLREKTKKIVQFDEALRKSAQGMLFIMAQHNGIGLAAPQVGLLKSLIICGNGKKETPVYLMCNPEILSTDGEVITGMEGCLSFPDQWMEVPRFQKVTVRYQDLKGKIHRLVAEDLLARCIQHEYDHLQGTLFIDYKEKKDV